MATDLEKQLVAFYGDDLVGILQRLSTGSNKAVEEVVQNIFSRMTIDAEIFGANITKEVARLQANGVSRTVIAQTIKNDMQTGGRIFGQYRNSIKGGIVEQVNQSGRLGQLQSFPPEQQLYQWTTVGGHKICVDCEGRAGEILTWEEWEREGLPGSGWSVCRGHCYCVLVPAGKLPKRVDAPGIRPTPTPRKPKPITENQSITLATRFLGMAQRLDDSLTGLVQKMANQTDSKLHGLKYRLKEFDSAKRKLLTLSSEKGMSYSQLAKEDLGDLNRYTFILDEKNYVSKYREIIAGVEADGYQLHSVGNYWNGKMYRGLNVKFRAPDGRYIEMQFNTRVQQKAKDMWSHKLYEEYRDVKTSKFRRAELEKIMTERWISTSRPSNWDAILDYP